MKKARMIKKGNRQTNLADGSLIETLIILSEDLVQVVAKVCHSPFFSYWEFLIFWSQAGQPFV